MIDYTIGFKVSMWAGIVYASLTFINFIYNYKALLNKDYLLASLYLPIISGIGMFSLMYPTLNTLGQLETLYSQIPIWNKELTDLILIRFTSIILGYKLVRDLFKIQTDFVRLQLNKKVIKQFYVDQRDSEFEIQMNWFNLSQISIYSIAAFIIQIAVFKNSAIIGALSLLNIVLFFIQDDWNIIYDYMRKFKKEMMKFHKYRINGSNCLLILLSTYSTWKLFDHKAALALFIILLISVYWRYLRKPTDLAKEIGLLENRIFEGDIKNGLLVLPKSKKKDE